MIKFKYQFFETIQQYIILRVMIRKLKRKKTTANDPMKLSFALDHIIAATTVAYILPLFTY